MKRADLRTAAWRASHLAGDDGTLRSVVDGPPPTLQFRDDRAGGSTGVNRWTSSYTHVGADLCFGQVTATLMAGSELLMEQEQLFLDILGRVDGYSIAGSLLEVREGDDVLALLEAVPTSIEGTWTLLMLADGKGAVVSLVDDTTIVARFERGAIAGSSGCNRFRASYEVDGDRIRIGPGMGTRKACTDPPGVMEQEQRFLSLFERAARFEVDDGHALDIFDGEGTRLLHFARVEGPIPSRNGVTGSR